MKKSTKPISFLLSAAMLICALSSMPVSAGALDGATEDEPDAPITSIEVVKLPDRKMMHKIEKDWFKYNEEWDEVTLDYSPSGAYYYNFLEDYTISRNMQGAVIKATYADGAETEFTVEENASYTGSVISADYDLYQNNRNLWIEITELGDYQARVALVDYPEIATEFTANHAYDKKVTDIQVIKNPEITLKKLEPEWFYINESLGMKYLYADEHGFTDLELCQNYLINKNMKGAVIRFTFDDGSTADWEMEENCDWNLLDGISLAFIYQGFYQNEDYDVSLAVEDLGDYKAAVTAYYPFVSAPDEYITVVMDMNPEHPNILLGDLNGDGKIDITDATAIQKSVAKLVAFDDNQAAAADVNFDGRIDITDATAVQKYAAKLITSFE